MVILWVLSCLALVSEAFECNTPTVKPNRAGSDFICNVILKDSHEVQLCDANVLGPTTQSTGASCTIFNVPRNASKAVLKKTYEKICKSLEKDLCGSQTDAKYNLIQAGTLKGRDTPHCPPSDYENFNDEECVTSEWTCTNKWVRVNHRSLHLQNNEECQGYWLSRITSTLTYAQQSDISSCEDGIMLVCERNNNCELAGFVYFGNYFDHENGRIIVTRIMKYR